MMRQKTLKCKHHFLGWLIFIAYESVSVGLVSGAIGHPLSYFSHYIVNAGLFYFHAYFVLPFLTAGRRSRNFITAPLLLSIELACFILLSFMVDYVLIKKIDVVVEYFWDAPGWNTKFVIGSLWRGIYFILFASGLYLFLRNQMQLKLNSNLEKEAIAKELAKANLKIQLANSNNARLKSQINPHFLFHTLTGIYSNAHRSEPLAAKAVLLLARLMRYMLESIHGAETSKLKREIEQVKNLIHLSGLHHGRTFVNLDYDESLNNVEVMPLILTTLTENMIKHGQLDDKDDPGILKIIREGSFIRIMTSNKVAVRFDKINYSSGMDNLKERLLHVYQNSAWLDYGINNKGYFEVNVNLPVSI